MQIERLENSAVLWKNDIFLVTAPDNPHLPREEGCHLIIHPNKPLERAWDNPRLVGEAFELASKVAGILVAEKIVDWINLQCNGNWGLLKGATPWFHIHVYGRKSSGKTWGQPVELPKLPNTYHNEPMSEQDIKRLVSKFRDNL